MIIRMLCKVCFFTKLFALNYICQLPNSYYITTTNQSEAKNSLLKFNMCQKLGTQRNNTARKHITPHFGQKRRFNPVLLRTSILCRLPVRLCW